MAKFIEKFMKKAIELSIVNVTKGGGPFGAVIVKNGKIISEGTNNVTKKNDPTAHAEIVAIRNASKKLKSYSLKGCEIYTSCEPCPMCLSAIYWSRLRRVYFGNTRKDAARIGFDDDFLYRQVARPISKRTLPMKQFLRHEARGAFVEWEEKPDKIAY